MAETIKQYLARIGRKGGQKKAAKPKGFAALTKRKLQEISRKGVAARKRKAGEKKRVSKGE